MSTNKPSTASKIFKDLQQETGKDFGEVMKLLSKADTVLKIGDAVDQKQANELLLPLWKKLGSALHSAGLTNRVSETVNEPAVEAAPDQPPAIAVTPAVKPAVTHAITPAVKPAVKPAVNPAVHIKPPKSPPRKQAGIAQFLWPKSENLDAGPSHRRGRSDATDVSIAPTEASSSHDDPSLANRKRLASVQLTPSSVSIEVTSKSPPRESNTSRKRRAPKSSSSDIEFLGGQDGPNNVRWDGQKGSPKTKGLSAKAAGKRRAR